MEKIVKVNAYENFSYTKDFDGVCLLNNTKTLTKIQEKGSYEHFDGDIINSFYLYVKKLFNKIKIRGGCYNDEKMNIPLRGNIYIKKKSIYDIILCINCNSINIAIKNDYIICKDGENILFKINMKYIENGNFLNIHKKKHNIVSVEYDVRIDGDEIALFINGYTYNSKDNYFNHHNGMIIIKRGS